MAFVTDASPLRRTLHPRSSGEMPTIEQHVQVSFTYKVLFTEDVFAPDNPLLAQTLAEHETDTPTRFLCVIETGVATAKPHMLQTIQAYARRHSEFIDLVAPPLTVPGGEGVKNDPARVQQVLAAIHDHKIDRHSYVVAIGGGALLDMVGFAAATAHRGVRLVRVPTTVLAQGDSGVGVKNGVNAFGKKNFIGTFAPPAAVINDFTFLETLSDREWRSGIAEAIKVSLLKDPLGFEELERLAPALAERSLDAMRRAVYRSAQLHLQHIATSGDPFEFGSSRPLDMGHWAAHKLESVSGYRLLHGEAVAIGLALDATYANLIGLLDDAAYQRIIGILRAVGLPTYAPELAEHLDEPEHPACVLNGLDEFREHLGGQLTIMLPRQIGRGIEVHSMDVEVVRTCIDMLRRGVEAL